MVKRTIPLTLPKLLIEEQTDFVVGGFQSPFAIDLFLLYLPTLKLQWWLLTAYAKASAVGGSTNSKQTLNGLFIFTFTNY
jgi:hypothetical protein